MKKTILKKILTLAMVLAAVVMTAGYSIGAPVTVNLAAVNSQWTAPGGGTAVTMWGFVEVTDPATFTCPDPAPPWDVGPRISATAGDDLTVNLRNCLDEPVSLFIPGQPKPTAPVADPGSNPPRMRSLDAETAPYAVGIYTWNNLKAGTRIYHSGTNLSKQVHMGLYGSLIVNVGDGIAYNGTSPVDYDNEAVLFFSEIDPALHDPEPKAAYPNNYKPRYFLVNGKSHPDASPILADPDRPLGTNERVLVRMISSALDDLVPTINGLHWNIVAEDGNPYLYPKKQVTALLSPMKTRDAILVADAEGTYPVFDRRFHLTNASSAPGGMMVMLEVGAVEGLPVVDITSPANGSSFAQGDQIDFAGSATDNGVDLTGSLVWTSNIETLNPIGNGGSFSRDDLSLGSHTITASATDDDGNTGSKSITLTITSTNTPPVVPPVAVDDFFEVVEGETLTAEAPGVLGNDSDPEDDGLTAILNTNVAGGTLTLNGNGSFVYTPDTDTTTDSFTYFANDGTENSTTPATVTITVTEAPAPPENQPPVANPDSATTTRNTAVTIDLTANDSDPDGNLNPASVSIRNVSRGVTITSLNNGSVVYTPRRNFQGTDTFTYTVFDSGTPPLESNEATVTVTVVR
jgi:VCBS repeat-containing protein